MTEWLSTTFAAVLAALALPSVGLPAVFAWCTLSATLLPLGSEPVVFGYIKLNPDMFVLAIVVATVGNTLGGMINYWLAYGAKQALVKDAHTPRALAWFERLGPKALFFSFLPGIGDPLTAVAGWLKMPWLPCLCWQALGKLLRYVVVTAALLYVPDAWWSALLSPLKSFFLS
jgi:membrane protein YqaA with SNARE-associated domain